MSLNVLYVSITFSVLDIFKNISLGNMQIQVDLERVCISEFSSLGDRVLNLLTFKERYFIVKPKFTLIEEGIPYESENNRQNAIYYPIHFNPLGKRTTPLP